MTDASNAALLQAYKDAIVANEDGIAELLKTVILELMGGSTSPIVISESRTTTEPPWKVTYSPDTVPLGVPRAEAVNTTADWTGIHPMTKEVAS